jgi:hypothetical protein
MEPSEEKANDPTPEMIEAGGNVLDEFSKAGGGLVCTPSYVAERVYLAMEKVRVATRPPER